ncbi:hypothetical protein D9M71_584040 [compost metagenome]
MNYVNHRRDRRRSTTDTASYAADNVSNHFKWVAVNTTSYATDDVSNHFKWVTVNTASYATNNVSNHFKRITTNATSYPANNIGYYAKRAITTGYTADNIIDNSCCSCTVGDKCIENASSRFSCTLDVATNQIRNNFKCAVYCVARSFES